MRTVKLMSQTVTGQTTGSTFTFEMPKGNRGIVNFHLSSINDAAGNVTAQLEGRLSDRMEFVVVDIDSSGTDVVTLTSGSATVTAQDIQVYPQMRVKVNAVNTATSAVVDFQLSN